MRRGFSGKKGGQKSVSEAVEKKGGCVLATAEKEKRIADSLTSLIDRRPQGDSNPRYRRESRKILKNQTLMLFGFPVLLYKLTRYRHSKNYIHYDNCVHFGEF
jgi:hypothetical protein